MKNILIVAPTVRENKNIRLAIERKGNALKNRYTVAFSGIGKAAAAATLTRHILEAEQPYDLVAVIGYAAGTLGFKQGEIVGLLGPNGAGKTTSFYMTTGLVVPNGGRIFLNDEEITKYPVYKRARAGIGYLAQEASVFRKLSVEDNIASVLELTGKPKEYQREKLESLIQEFRLQKVRKNLGDRLSGGERRRTEIARCLAIDPKFIMLDEPFAGVDPIAVEDIQYIVWKLKDKNIGILITDHNVQETLNITDRAYLLFEGRILFEGTPEVLAENSIVREKYLGRDFVLRKREFQF